MAPTLIVTSDGKSSLASSISSIASHHSPTDLSFRPASPPCSDSSSQHASPPPSPPSSIDCADSNTEPAVKAVVSSMEVARTVSSLLTLSHELSSRVSGSQTALGRDVPLGREDSAENLMDIATLITQTLEAVKQLAHLQEESSERLFNLENTMVDVRGDMGSVQYRANRLLYHTREHVRKERETIRDEGRAAIAVQGTLTEDVYQLNLDLISVKERNMMILNGLLGLEAALEALRANDAPSSVQPGFRRLRDILRDYSQHSLELLTLGAWRVFGWMMSLSKTVIHGCQWAFTRCTSVIALPTAPYDGLLWGFIWFLFFLLVFGYCTRSAMEDRPVWQMARA